MVRNAAQTGLLIAKRRHQLNRAGGMRRAGEPRMRQADLAKLLDVAASTVANWERGKSFPERHLGNVERVLGISLTGEPEPDPQVQEIRELGARLGLTPAQQDDWVAVYRRRQHDGPRERAG